MDNDNMTLYLDPDTFDLEFDENGYFKRIYGDDTTAQNVRNTLLTWKKEFFTDLTHGTAYERIMGKNQNEINQDEIEEILREAVLQEVNVYRVDDIQSTYNGRTIEATVVATLKNGEKIKLEVSA